jgi:hypothetical protein
MKKYAAYALSALIALAAGMSAMQAPAYATSVEIEINPTAPGARTRHRCDPRYERCRDGWDRRFCTEERALRKAERMGLRRARVVESNRRVVVVRGRDRRDDRVRIVFGRDHYCPVYR